MAQNTENKAQGTEKMLQDKHLTQLVTRIPKRIQIEYYLMSMISGKTTRTLKLMTKVTKQQLAIHLCMCIHLTASTVPLRTIPKFRNTSIDPFLV